ncbi:MAG: NAD(P)/FAD-dependent oxidoreductase [Betaproteobacteria bacterium]|nr:NAD(P)/FAD-dependent oxidoreductase [Betaproteobacteria bacterium]NBZ98241.1 NAD(P)/FAD-dependent oxidoreductase [Betaproteobacteria bacterium]NDB42941.1 NAD(P)/FAD-dependent oxidoreductase [Betaproteobacteria bacterium]NDD02322.1 NAD(P)/FAD-dependent oxidoreductase [Betaproteobacteria bacterium]NDE24192.1 NAD(P)/FAD-dependent oxidoreductase [Betaproteobacteria bacterium]
MERQNWQTERVATLIQTEALIIGAGPVGLFQAFQLGLQDIRCHVVDALPQVGGQCVELYANKPIYDIPGIPLCTGQALIDQLQQQVKPFAPQFHLQELVSDLKATDDGQWHLQTNKGTQFKAATVFIAAGVGAFVKRGLSLPGFDELLGKQIFHAAPNPSSFKGQHLIVLGDSDAALEACADWRQGPEAAASVTLVHRRDQFQAAAQLVEDMRQACAKQSMRFVAGQPTGLIQANGQFTGLEILNAQGDTEVLPANALLLCLGISPKLGPLSDWGLALERKQLPVNTETFATQAPGIFAVGDINTYPGKKKLILCGFHEATLAAFGASALLRPDQKTLLQYTTTSTHLHKLLGVS